MYLDASLAHVHKDIGERPKSCDQFAKSFIQQPRRVRFTASQLDMSSVRVPPPTSRELNVMSHDDGTLLGRVDRHIVVSYPREPSLRDRPRIMTAARQNSRDARMNVLIEHESHACASRRTPSTSTAVKAG